MSIPTEIVYRYNGDPASEEMELHASLGVTLPHAHSVIVRKGKAWQVSKVEMVPCVSELTRIPVYRIFLTDAQSPTAVA
jgi:hypothetical protein